MCRMDYVISFINYLFTFIKIMFLFLFELVIIYIIFFLYFVYLRCFLNLDINIFTLFLPLAKLSAKYLIPRIAFMEAFCYL